VCSASPYCALEKQPNKKRRIQSMKNYVLLLLTANCVTIKFDPLIA
jgi:hypothetical protein